MVKNRRVGMVRNPNRKKKASRPASKKRSAARRSSARKHRPRSKPKQNPALMTLGFSNPRGGHSMAKKKKKHSSSKHRRPAFFGKKGNPHRGGRRRHSRNPGLLSGGMRLLQWGFFALIGQAITREVPQMVLKARNSGAIGYVANTITALAAGAFARRFIARENADAVMLGGGLYVANRIYEDYGSPVGKILSQSGMGDVHALAGLGPGYFPTPVPTDMNGNAIIPPEIRAVPPAPSLPAAAGGGGMGMAATRFRSRFAS